MWDNDSVYPKIETGYKFKLHLNVVLVNDFNIQTFNKDDSTILKIKYYNPPSLVFQPIPIKVKVKNTEFNKLRHGKIINTLTSIDIRETGQMGDKIIQIEEGVIYRENFMISPPRKIIEKLFTLKQKYKDENLDSLQGLVKLVMNSLYGVQIRKDINESYYCESETRMETDCDENVLYYWKLSNGNYTIKMRKEDGLYDDCDIKNTLPAHSSAFILSNSERNMNTFMRKNYGFYTNNIYYSDSDSLYIEKKYWDVLDRAELVGARLCQG